MRRRGFTLLELLVATAVLSILGLALMVVLRGGLATWRRAEARRASFDAGQAVLRQLREDLLCAVGPYETSEPYGQVDLRLVCDADERGRTRLFLTRAIKGESEHPVLGLAGNAVASDGVYDYRADTDEARHDRLRATGGTAEVAWVIDDQGVLYRGVRAPVGPPGSLFGDVDPYELAPLWSPDAAPEDPSAQAPSLLRPFATEVLYFEVRFWTQFTTSWDLKYPCSKVKDDSGPTLHWDSTRAILQPPEGLRPDEFDFFVGRKSLDDPRDDVLPEKVRVTLVIREAPEAGSSTYLSATIGPREQSLPVQEPGRLQEGGGYVLIDDEWIRYSEVSGGSAVVSERGARGTAPAEHGLNSVVEVGRQFVTVVALPGGREDWGIR
ncbi:MAG: type II secretion system protein [Planctomycetes bacterium]|nr:type II secretion system protein [Planctomycetota bacterium]